MVFLSFWVAHRPAVAKTIGFCRFGGPRKPKLLVFRSKNEVAEWPPEVAEWPPALGDHPPAPYQDRQNPYSRELFGEKCIVNKNGKRNRFA